MQGHSPCTPRYAGAPPRAPGDFRFTTKVTKGVPGLRPWTPVRGYRTFRARSALLRLAPCCFLRFYRQPCKRGSMGDTFPRGSRRLPLGRRELAVSLSLIQQKNCWMPGGEHRPYMADRGRLGYGNKKWEQGNKHLFLLYIHLYIYLL